MTVLHGQVAVHNGDDHMVVPGLDGSVHHQDVVVKDSGLNHGMPTSTQEVGGLGVPDQHLDQIDALGTQVVGGGRKAGADLVA